MNARTIVLVLATVMVLSLGQIMFKAASATISISRPLSFLRPTMIFALLIYGVATVMWVLVLKKLPLSAAFPFYGLTFLLVPMFSRVFLGEKIHPATVIGGVVILLGVVIAQVRG